MLLIFAQFSKNWVPNQSPECYPPKKNGQFLKIWDKLKNLLRLSHLYLDFFDVPFCFVLMNPKSAVSIVASSRNDGKKAKKKDSAAEQAQWKMKTSAALTQFRLPRLSLFKATP